MENKNQIPQTVFNVLTATAKTTVLVLLVLFVTFKPHSAQAANALIGQELVIVAQTNAIRAEVGLPALTVDSRLTQSAIAKANDMATNSYFDHANPDGSRMSYWINGAGYTYSLAGENLAKGFSSLSRLMNAWVASPSHYKNLVEPKFTNIGIGMAEGWYEGQLTLFVVQHFGVPASRVVKDTAPMVSIVAPLIESVAGASDAQTVVNNGPVPTPTVIKTTSAVSISKSPVNPPAFIENVQASPLTNSSIPTNTIQFWPIFALMVLALIGYLDEYLPLWVATKSRR